MSAAPGLLAAALLLDLAAGDPNAAAHPVRMIGGLIRWAEKRARRDGRHQRSRGVGLALFVIAVAYLAGLGLEQLARQADAHWALQGWLAFSVSALLLWSCLGVRSMWDHVQPVLKALAEQDLQRARLAVSRIVGRETAQLDERGVLRACLETIAEGLCDGVVAPLFFAALGGAPLALAYRAANTLDSMVGYKDDHYRDLGWASARLDDLLNWVPARKAVLYTMLAAWMLRFEPMAAFKMARRDGPKQPSPNSGWPEGAFAGALSVQLGGPLRYRGQISQKATLGDPLQPLSAEVVHRGLKLFMVASASCVAVLELMAWFA